jgi:DNA-binding NarL/FixJ family response regulator
MTAVRILVADDHEVVRQGLRALLQTQPGWEVAWEAGTGREAVEIAKRVKPDVNVLDLSMPDMNGLEATRQILGHDSQSEVLILTMHESEQLIRDVLDAGARGYVLKSDAGRDLVAAVDALQQHKLFFTSKVASMVLAEYLKTQREGRNGSSSSSSLLSPREREIVQLLAEGKTNKEVSATLNISVKTAETHRHHIMQKLELRSIADLVHYAIRNHIVAP